MSSFICRILTLLAAAATVTSLTVIADPQHSPRDEHVITATNTSTGTVISVLSRKGNYSIPEPRFLSPAFGSLSRWQVLVVTSFALTSNTTSQHIVLVPVEKGIYMLDFYYDGFELSLHNKHTVELGCDPIGIFKLNPESFYLLCLSGRMLNGHNLTLNRSMIEDSWVNQTSQLNILVGNSNNLSNFVGVNFGSTCEKWIYFAKGSSLYEISPFLVPGYSIIGGSGGISFDGYECDTDSIVYTRDGILIAYCRNNDVSYMYFNIGEKRVVNATFSAVRQPYVCPNPDVRLEVNKRHSRIQYGLWSQNTNNLAEFKLPSTHFDSGVCFIGPENNSLFAYSDKQEGVFLFDTSMSTFKQLSSNGCLNFSSCDPLLIFESRYLAIREQQGAADTVKIIDTAENYSVIIEEHVIADMVAVIYALNPQIDETPSTVEAGNEMSVYWSFTVLAIPVLAVIGLILLYRRRRGRLQNEEAQDGDDRSLLHDDTNDLDTGTESGRTDLTHATEQSPSTPTDEAVVCTAQDQDVGPNPDTLVFGHNVPMLYPSNRIRQQSNNNNNNNIPRDAEDR